MDFCLSFIADERTNIRYREQFSICCRIETEQLVIEEHIFKLASVPITYTATWSQLMKDHVF